MKFRFSLPIIFLLVLLFSSAWRPQVAYGAAGPELTYIRVRAEDREAFREGWPNADLWIDYGSFVWVGLNAADYDRLDRSKMAFEPQSNAYTLSLGEQVFDPLAAEPALPSGWSQSAAEGPDLHLVQLMGPTQDAWLDGLKGHGLEVVQYLHPFTYMVWGTQAQAQAAAAESFVRWEGDFAPAYRVLPQWQALSDTPVEVHALVFRGADPARALTDLAGLGAEVGHQRVLNDTWTIVGFRLAGSALELAAQVPGVYSIQPAPTDGGLRGEMSNQINVGNYDGTNLAFTGYASWLSSVGLDGSGVVMANVDGGIYDSHPDLINRMLPCSGSTCGGLATDTHGTHTAGIMAGDASSGSVDSFGFLRGQGMAPGANLVEQLYWPTYTDPGGMLLLIQESYSNTAVLSGNSWGPSGSPLGYDNNTLQVDIGVRDASPGLAGNQQFTYVLSFMNGYGGTSTQGTPDEAKNLFNIGSTKMQTGSGSQDLNINDLSANSAHGPALDGRTIPHLVAPGCNVDSTLTASGYGLNCGTSMASPHVTGAAGLFFEFYRNLTGARGGITLDPSPALVKAAFLAVAHNLAGFKDADGGTLGQPFDNKQGWGRMDAAAVLDPQVDVLYYDAPMLLNMTGEQWTVSLETADPNEPVRLMLVWTDAPGHGLGGSSPAWNNDLDLEVAFGGETYKGNIFDSGSGWSKTGGSADGKNNTEGIFLGPTASGVFTATVTAANINSDGVPGLGDGTDQDFSLVCYNCVVAGAPGPDYKLYFPILLRAALPRAPFGK
jgi:hypothetical protein